MIQSQFRTYTTTVEVNSDASLRVFFYARDGFDPFVVPGRVWVPRLGLPETKIHNGSVVFWESVPSHKVTGVIVEYCDNKTGRDFIAIGEHVYIIKDEIICRG